MTAPYFASHKHLVARLFCATLLATAASAAGAYTTHSMNVSPEAQYQADVAHCKSGQSNEDQATCLKEAGAALEAAKRGKLTTAPSYTTDQTKRCQELPANKQQDCLALMSDQGSTHVEGSVNGGGVLRETTITVPAGSQ
ncbi:MAG TPA: hypothetical protein VFR20_07025 [Burkholderiaceae bacterium]|nr:hypothetical protein [Burkholderiaceae bacterium]